MFVPAKVFFKDYKIFFLIFKIYYIYWLSWIAQPNVWVSFYELILASRLGCNTVKQRYDF